MGIAIVTRAQWGARPPRGRHLIAMPTPRLWVHHTAGSERGAAGMRQIQRFHMDTRGWNDIAYSFVVDVDGTVYEGRGAGVAGGHTQGDNSRSHAICVMGNFDTQQPTPAALNAVVELARMGHAHGWWVPTLGGHRDAPGASTACPGRHLYARLPELRHRLAHPGPPVPPPPPPPPPEEEDDMADYVLQAPGKPVAHLCNGKMVKLGDAKSHSEAVESVKAAVGNRVLDVTPEAYDAYDKLFEG